MARCDYRTLEEHAAYLGRFPDEDTSEELATFAESAHFDVAELAVLTDGREVVLAERGWASKPHGSTVEELWAFLDEDTVTQTVLSVVLPDDDEPVEDHPYDWLAQQLTEQGVPTTGDRLRAVPYEVELSDRLRTRLAGG